MIIKNTNGKSYKKIFEYGSYTLLLDINSDFNGVKEYVVAYENKKFEDGYSWLKGYYVYSLQDAIKVFMEKSYYRGNLIEKEYLDKQLKKIIADNELKDLIEE